MPVNRASSVRSMAGSYRKAASNSMAEAGGKSTVLMAAAMQDHFMRNLGIKLPGAPKRAAAKTAKADALAPLESKLPSEVPTMTLAQKMGLVPRPAPRLTQDGWMDAAERSRKRMDSNNDCAICREPFQAEEQVILSCSHVFHRACMVSFERHARGQACCPLCRTKDYEKRLFEEGRRRWESLCALKLQAVWRGHGGRRQYQHLLDTVVPADPAKRRAFFARRVGIFTERLVAQLDQERDDDIEDLFAEADRALALSREVFGGQGGGAGGESAAFRSEELAQTGGRRGAGLLEEAAEEEMVDWEEVERQALQRDEHLCAICLSDLGGPEREKALTSCSHIFHAQCLASFERFAAATCADRQCCPCCRSHYTKRLY